jgi:hypothetical protein
MLLRLSHRRSQRALLRIPISVSWKPPVGPANLNVAAETEVVGAHGALIRLQQAPEQNARVEITHGHTRQTAPGRVIAVEPPGKENEPYRVTVELSVPSETFWGLSLPPLHSA